MTDADQGILVVNAGSSSIKVAVFPMEGGDTPFLSAQIDRIGGEAACAAKDKNGNRLSLPAFSAEDGRTHEEALKWLLPMLERHGSFKIAAAGHRVVHGGQHFNAPVLIDAETVEALRRLIPLARTHQPHNIAAIQAVRSIWPDLPQVACFDTAFHATIPEAARTLALPQAVRDEGVRRYGFHGQSYTWIAGRLRQVAPAVADGRVVVAHLGNGASLCGLVGGKSRATSMSFTPLDGLVMGERPGLTDPGAILFMFEEMGMQIADVRQALFKESGLKGLSGISNDMRTLLASDDPAARLAVDVYVHRVVREVGAIAAEIGGIDALVFTAGVGENAVPVRAAIADGCAWLGCTLDREANEKGDLCISRQGSPVSLYVVPANEEAVIAASCRDLLNVG